jgi:hypothetical protein
MHATGNPSFFDGTPVAAHARSVLAAQRAASRSS